MDVFFTGIIKYFTFSVILTVAFYLLSLDVLPRLLQSLFVKVNAFLGQVILNLFLRKGQGPILTREDFDKDQPIESLIDQSTAESGYIN